MSNLNTKEYILLSPGTIVKNFKIINTVGQGSFSIVYQVQDMKSGNKDLILKHTNLNLLTDHQKIIAEMKREREVLMQIHHPNITEMIEGFEDQNQLYILMKKMTPILNFIKNIPDKLKKSTVQSLCFDIVMSVVGLQAQNPIIMHRDIKMENFLIDIKMNDKNELIQYTSKLIDFNLSRQFVDNEQFTVNVGNKICRAPEAFSSQNYNEAVDVWAIAIVMYQLLLLGDGESIFVPTDTQIPKSQLHICAPYQNCKSSMQLMKRIENGQYDEITEKQVENNYLFQIVKNLLNIDPNVRMQNFRNILQSKQFIEMYKCKFTEELQGCIDIVTKVASIEKKEQK